MVLVLFVVGFESVGVGGDGHTGCGFDDFHGVGSTGHGVGQEVGEGRSGAGLVCVRVGRGSCVGLFLVIGNGFIFFHLAGFGFGVGPLHFLDFVVVGSTRSHSSAVILIGMTNVPVAIAIIRMVFALTVGNEQHDEEYNERTEQDFSIAPFTLGFEVGMWSVVMVVESGHGGTCTGKSAVVGRVVDVVVHVFVVGWEVGARCVGGWIGL